MKNTGHWPDVGPDSIKHFPKWLEYPWSTKALVGPGSGVCLWASDSATKGKEAGTEYLYGLWDLPLLQAERAKVIGETGTPNFYPLLGLVSNNSYINCHHNITVKINELFSGIWKASYHRVFLMKLKFINELSLCGCCNNHELIFQHY